MSESHWKMVGKGRWAFPFLLLAAALAGVSGALAFVTAAANSVAVVHGGTGTALLSVDASGTIDGLNGRLGFDPAMLTDFDVSPGPGAEGFTALGNTPSDGVFRFVLCDPTGARHLDLTQPVLRFAFRVPTTAPAPASTTVVFTSSVSAAARIVSSEPPSVLSVGLGGPGGSPAPEPVVFQSFQVTIGQNGARNWLGYE